MTSDTTSSTSGTSLKRSIITGGFIVGLSHVIIYHLIFANILGGVPLTDVYQYIASGALGLSAFEGGIFTALIGVLFHFFISYTITAVFLISADKISLIGRFPLVLSVIYGFGVFVVMNIIVTPLSAAPVLPEPSTFELAVTVVEHMLVGGLLVGVIAKRRA